MGLSSTMTSKVFPSVNGAKSWYRSHRRHPLRRRGGTTFGHANLSGVCPATPPCCRNTARNSYAQRAPATSTRGPPRTKRPIQKCPPRTRPTRRRKTRAPRDSRRGCGSRSIATPRGPRHRILPSAARASSPSRPSRSSRHQLAAPPSHAPPSGGSMPPVIRTLRRLRCSTANRLTARLSPPRSSPPLRRTIRLSLLRRATIVARRRPRSRRSSAALVVVGKRRSFPCRRRRKIRSSRRAVQPSCRNQKTSVLKMCDSLLPSPSPFFFFFLHGL